MGGRLINAYDFASRGPAGEAALRHLLASLSPAEAAALVASPEFTARPGQVWEEGAEEITVAEGGRGSGKSFMGTLAVLRAARDPERWGGFALLAGPDPQAVESDMLMGASGLLTLGRQVADAGLGPGFVYNPSKLRVSFEAPRGGGGGGLTVLLRASSKPHGGRGPNVGLAWLDEFGVWYHRKTDQQGTNLWRAVRPAIRAGRPTSHVIVTMTPSRQPEVRALQRDAERPECPACRQAHLEEHGTYDGEEGQEPWRLPRSEQRRLHPLLDTRTTDPVRECPRCQGEVIASVRTVFFATTDNPMTDPQSRARARVALSVDRAENRMEFAPRGEADSSPRGALVKDEDVRRELVDARVSEAPDRWAAALAALGIVPGEVVVLVDPAVTAKQSSDETGLGVAGPRTVREKGASWRQAVGLQDWSLRPDEVESGAPSAVWGPRAYWLACLWGASRIIVETNQGGEEVLAAPRAEIARGLGDEQAVAERLAREFGKAGQTSAASFGAVARRVLQASRAVRVEAVPRRADKVARWDWYGSSASRGEQAVACLPWTGGARAWAPVVAQLTGLERPRVGQPTSATRGSERRDRADWLVAAAEVLLGVRETKDGRVVQAGPGWMSSASPGLLRR